MTSHHRSQDHRPTPDGETLCALFDGQLQGDAARFALKRLGHDAQWRQACGRWQLYGDVMRGQAAAVAPAGFADRVALAMAGEAPLAVPAEAARSQRPATASRLSSRRGWMGGALAASVAMAALFVTRPFADAPSPSAPEAAPAQVASVATPVAPAVPAPAPEPKAPEQGVGLGAAAVAVAEVPRRAVEQRRSTRSQSQRASLRASRQEPVAVAAVAAAPTAALALQPAAAHGASAPSANPFQPQHEETSASRPWPRAVLPQYSSSGAMTASYGSSSAGASFYPFEPTLSDDTVDHRRDAAVDSDVPPPH